MALMGRKHHILYEETKENKSLYSQHPKNI